jgi:ubiquinone/menaquinone biosynthesis C-methylase UbiE
VWLALALSLVGGHRAQAEPQKPDEGWQLERNAAEQYERLLVPAIFAPWATDLLTRLPPAAGERVLDVACGTGIVARRAARLVGPGGKVAGLDYSPAMIAVAQTRKDGAGIEWRQGDAHALPFAAASFDVVFIQQGLQFFSDRALALREVHRVLASGGRVGISVWLGVERNPYGRELAAAVERHVDATLGAGMRTPFVQDAVGHLDTLLRETGFREVHAEAVQLALRVPSLADFVRQHLTALPVAARLGEAGEATREALVSDVVQALSAYETADGWAVPFEAAVASGKK